MASNFVRGRRLIVVAVASAVPVFGASAARSDLIVNGVNQTQLTTAPSILDVGGSVAAMQFAATPLCVGWACGIDGPAASATLLADNLGGGAQASLKYSVAVLGDPGLVPILLSGLYAVVNPPEFPDGMGGTTASAAVSIRNSLSEKAFVFQSTCYNYTYFLNESSPPKNCGSGSFSGSFMAAAGSTFSVDLFALAVRTSPDQAPPATVSAYIDPFFEIDPSWAASHSGYALQFEAGVGNGAPGSITTAVPEPQTLLLIAAGLVALTARRRTSRSAR